MAISTFNGLNVALRGLLAQQRALDVTSHNIANANTEGYSRQVAELAAAEPLANVSIWGMVVPGQLGQGVSVEAYRRIRDVFTDSQARGAMAEQARQEVEYRELSGIERAFPEPGPSGLQAIMSRFWSTWQDVASNPENLGARQALAQQGEALAAAFRTTARTLADMHANVDVEIDAAVGEANAIGTQIAALSNQIATLRAAGQQPNDLLDARDRLLDELARLGNVDVAPSGELGRLTVRLGGLTLVSDAGGGADSVVTPLVRAGAGGVDEQFANGGLTGGTLRGLELAWQRLLHPDHASSYRTMLDTLAHTLQSRVNAQHAAGTDLSGTPRAAGADFFTPAPGAVLGAAAGIRINSALTADPTLIRARGASENGPGSNGNALGILGLRSIVTTAGSTFDGYYTGLVTGLGVAAQEAKRGLGATEIVVNSLLERRAAASGVSLDEEMANMIKFQHAFSAASRVLSAMDDNLNRLINSTGRVGL